ncbi:MAG: hypothetical protein WD793_02350 [Steroidobacteraceae bacterium]
MPPKSPAEPVTESGWQRFKNGLNSDWQAIVSGPRSHIYVGAAVIAVMVWWNGDRSENFEAALSAKNSSLEAKDETIGRLERDIARLQVAAGISELDSRTAFSVLTNEELARKTASLVAIIRKMHDSATKRLERIGNDLKGNSKMTEGERFIALTKVEKEEALKLSHAVGGDSISIVEELRRRIPLAQREHILSAGLQLKLDDPENDGQTARFLFVTANAMGGYVMSQMPILADELEALYKLLPPD